jgi:hypothetical protein
MPPEPIGDLAVKIWSEERQPLFFGGIFGDTLVDWKLIYIKISNLRGDVSLSLPTMHCMQQALQQEALALRSRIPPGQLSFSFSCQAAATRGDRRS